jgi:hypothetical protein
VPADQSPGSDDKHAALPIAPDGKRQFTSFDRPLENAELMAESQDLELQQRPAPEGSENSGQKSGQ